MRNTGKNTLTIAPARKSVRTKKRGSKSGGRSKRVTAKSNPVGTVKKKARRAGAAPKKVAGFIVVSRGFNRSIMYAMGLESRGDNVVNTLSYDRADATVYANELSAKRAADVIMSIQRKYDDRRAAIVVTADASESDIQKKLSTAEGARKTNPAPSTGFVIRIDYRDDDGDVIQYWSGNSLFGRVWVNFPQAKRLPTKRAAEMVADTLRNVADDKITVESVSAIRARSTAPFGSRARRTNPDASAANKYIVAIAGGAGSVKILAYWDGAGWSWEHKLAARFTKAAATELAERAAKANKRPAMVARFDVAPGQISHKIAADK